MRVGLFTAVYSTIVGLVRRVNVAVLLAIATVGEPPVAAVVFAFEGFLAWKRKENEPG